VDTNDILPWSDSFNTGISKIDEQHQRLVHLINHLARKVAHQEDSLALNQVFDKLAAYAVYHFQTEEAIWHMFLPDDVTEIEHRKLHASFIDQVSKLKEHADIDGEDVALEEVLFFLIRWLTSHILESDNFSAQIALAVQSGVPLDIAKQQAKEKLTLAAKSQLGILINVLTSYAKSSFELLKAEHELRVTAVAFNSQDGIMITDQNQVILRVNQAFTKITGYEFAEVIGKTPAFLKSGRQDQLFYKKLWRVIEIDGNWQGEIWNRHKSGRIYPEWLSISAVKDHTGAVKNYVATFSDITKQKEAESAVHDLAFFDPLTKLPNRRLLLDRFQHALATLSRDEQYCALMLIDLDNFKDLNASKGLDIGDEVLILTAERLQSCLRPSDTIGMNTISHIGGDEFAVVLEVLGTESETAASRVAFVSERIRSSMKAPFNVLGQECNCSVSIGVGLFKGGNDSHIEYLIKHPSKALEQAKKEGGDRVCFFDPDIQSQLDSIAQLKEWMREALDDQYRLYYQIQVNQNGMPVGAEALIRWHHPVKGIVSPAQFIPLAEESGLIVDIGNWVLRTACNRLKTWEVRDEFRNLVLSVNVSAKQFAHSNFVAQVTQILDQTGVNPSKLKLELTESMLASNIDNTISKMQALKAVGIQFSLDDFGTGFSSLTYLKRLPLDQLKIDQSFVRDATNDQSDAAIVRTIIALGLTLEMNVVAEGVETQEQYNFLASNGCHTFQGYLFSRPVPIEEFENQVSRVAPRIKNEAT
jgi:diguanylate cyclase (GGDEF)-like protein/hemerythrin-like metal-binding protein/PAS domain S-box-containing protein